MCDRETARSLIRLARKDLKAFQVFTIHDQYEPQIAGFHEKLSLPEGQRAESLSFSLFFLLYWIAGLRFDLGR